MRALLLTLFLAPTMALAQVFYSDEEFYGYLEHRARMELLEAQAREVRVQQEREAERAAIIKRLEEAAFRMALRAAEEQ